MANVLNLKVDILAVEEGPALGGAMLAAVGCGEWDSVEEMAEKVVSIKETVEPDPQIVDLYEERYKLFKKIYPTLKDLFQDELFLS